MISGLVAPGALGLTTWCGGRLVYSTLSTSAISLSFICHMRSSTDFSTSSQRPSVPGPGAAAVPAGENFGTPTVVGGAGTQAGVGYLQVFSDFNRDGKSDFLFLNGANLYAFLSNGDGTYTLRANYVPQFAAEAQTPGSKFLVGDFNGDGLKDLAVFGADQTITFSLSNRDATSRQVSQPYFGSPQTGALIFAGIFY